VTYDDVDPVLLPWLKRHGLHVFRRYRDEEVRSIDVVDDAGDRYQIAVSPPSASGKLTVFAGNYLRKKKQKRIEYSSDVSGLERTLEDAYSKIMEWVAQEGHTRTPVL
jgi:hypothetical protein